MAKQVFKLTDAACEKAKAKADRYERPDGGGLYLVVHPTGLKTWVVRYRRDGKPRKYTITGNFPTIDLKAARAQAKWVLQKVSAGGDPASEKLQARVEAADHSTEYPAVAAQFLKLVLTRGKKPRRPRARTLEALAHSLGMVETGDNTWAPKGSGLTEKWKGRKVNAITKRDVLDHLDSMIAAGIRIQTNRALTYLHQFFGWCVRRDLVTANPCANLDKLVEETPRERVLSDGELRAVWDAASQDQVFGPVYQMLVLTAQRRSEVSGMEWREIDLDARTWTIPKERAKNHEENVVPLSAPAIALLKAQSRFAGSPFVFTLTGRVLAGFTCAKDRLDRVMAKHTEVKPWTIHDLRRTAASGLQKLCPPHIIEMILNHSGGTYAGVAGVYQRDKLEDEKRAALDAWALHVQRITGGNVIALAA